MTTEKDLPRLPLQARALAGKRTLIVTLIIMVVALIAVVAAKSGLLGCWVAGLLDCSYPSN